MDRLWKLEKLFDAEMVALAVELDRKEGPCNHEMKGPSCFPLKNEVMWPQPIFNPEIDSDYANRVLWVAAVTAIVLHLLHRWKSRRPK